MKAIEERIMRILVDDFKVQHEPIGPDTTFADLSFDSLVIVEFALMLDTEFGIRLESDELAETMTIADVAALAVLKGAVPG